MCTIHKCTDTAISPHQIVQYTETVSTPLSWRRSQFLYIRTDYYTRGKHLAKYSHFWYSTIYAFLKSPHYIKSHNKTHRAYEESGMRGTTLKKNLKTKLAQFYTGLMVNKGLNITVKVALYLERDLRFAGVRMGRGGRSPWVTVKRRGRALRMEAKWHRRRNGVAQDSGQGGSGEMSALYTQVLCLLRAYWDVFPHLSPQPWQFTYRVSVYVLYVHLHFIYKKNSIPPGRIFAPLAILPHWECVWLIHRKDDGRAEKGWLTAWDRKGTRGNDIWTRFCRMTKICHLG